MLFRGVGIGEKPPRCYFSNGGNAMKNNRNFLMGALLTVCGLLLILCTVLLFTGRSKPADSTVELPEVRNNGTAIQWKTGSGNEWHDLVSLDTLRGADGEKGADGRTPEFRVDGNLLQWRYCGSEV